MAKSEYTSQQLRRMLEARYPPDKGYEVFHEVGNRTAGAGSWADTIAFASWPSLGLAFTGFEIKVSRGDWLRELKQPAKSYEVMKYCRYWYLVAAPNVVDMEKDPIPATWGVLEVRGGGLVQVKEAPRLHDDQFNPVREFLGSFMRSVRKTRDSRDYIHVSELESKIAEQADEVTKRRSMVLDGEIRSLEYKLDNANRALADAKNIINGLESALGVPLPSPTYSLECKQFMSTLALLRKHGVESFLARLDNAKTDLSRFLGQLEGFLDNVRQ